MTDRIVELTGVEAKAYSKKRFKTEKVRKILTLVGAQVDKELHDQLQAQAQREDRSTASLVRQALKMYLKLNDNK